MKSCCWVPWRWRHASAGAASASPKVGFARLPPGRVKFPGPVDQNRILGLSLKSGEMLALSGLVRRARISDPVCAAGAAIG